MSPYRNVVNSLGKPIPGPQQSRSGNIILLSAWVLVLAFAFAAFTIDIGYVSVAKAQLQSAVDASTLAGAMELDSNGSQTEIETAVKNAVQQVAAENPVGTWDGLLLDRDTDIELGRREWNVANQAYVFNFGSEATPYNIVRVTGRYDFIDTGSGTEDRRIPVFFAPAINGDKVKLNVSAIATYQPRDVMLVQDYSGSMNDDTEFKSVDSLGLEAVTSAITTMWTELGEPSYGSMPFTPGWLTVGGVPEDADASIPHIDVEYRGDEVHVTSTLALTKVVLLDKNGYYLTYDNLSGLTGTFADNRQIRQVWVLSGSNAVLNETGNGEQFDFQDSDIEAYLGLDEVDYPHPSGSWTDFINYVNTSGSVNEAGFRYQYATMCLINYWNERRANYSQTPGLWVCPTQPLEAAKNAADVMIDYIQEVSADDRLGLSIYTHPSSAGATLESSLTSNLDSVRPLYRERQASHYDAMTNIGAGMKVAREELEANARPEAFRMIVLLTDGVANRPSGSAAWYALNQATLCEAAKIRVMTISLGLNADTTLMQQIADTTGGRHFNVPGGGTIEEYEAQLKDVFREIAADRPLRLLPAVSGVE
ncbi:MAG: vWA domain-containing protein [Planctomycetota bacterium]|jgi:Flp pilus assembly protein TadG